MPDSNIFAKSDSNQRLAPAFGLHCLHRKKFKALGGAAVVTENQDEKAEERTTFVFLAVFLATALAVAIVGGYGLAVWLSQLILGPPGSGI